MVRPARNLFPHPGCPAMLTSLTQLAQQIDEALRSHCGIAAKQYFVAAISEDGKPMTFFSPGQKLNNAVIRQFFDMGRFQHVMARIDAGADPILDDGFAAEDITANRTGSRGRMRGSHPRRTSIFEEWDNPLRPAGRKRPRPRHPLNDDDDVPMTVSSRKGIKINDADAVWNFYEQRFKNCQQTACKLIAKAWVKAVEPKKQSTHPYTGSDEKAPDWWPKPWGPTKDDKVRHKEPDHLYKRERVHLLVHILRLVVEPNVRQHGDIQKLGLNVKKLEETSYEALSSFFMDNDTNARKRPYLNEIFKMARQEERFRNGEIDGSTEVYVMAEDKIPDNYASDNEEGPFVKEDDDSDMSRIKVNNTQQHCVAQTPTTGPTPTQPLHGGHGSFMSELPVRGSSFTPTMLSTEMAPQPHSFVDSSGITVTDQAAVTAPNPALTMDIVTSPHDTSRRPSVFSEYTSPGGSNLYTPQWQQSGSAGQTQSPMYAYAPSQANASQPPFLGQTVHMGQNQSFIGGSFEETSRTDYDAHGAPIFRAGDLPHPPVSQQQGYYVPNDGRNGLRGLTQVVEGVPRSQM
ncbi:hypothetical protein UVI_02037560 [Ustilaginoidea virens]|uniref:Subtelomeric hrmA-associated cluster protein AFUB-079030/YDR124W-like helical bundle domain-containing protein n=1 Tax=Ustilaginoidea virens TaxID=1159556 RepID=A0A1B5KT92_USTVR|nr:hypothetical protein UVI_02037560 [Ustilaginoidea virens]